MMMRVGQGQECPSQGRTNARVLLQPAAAWPDLTEVQDPPKDTRNSRPSLLSTRNSRPSLLSTTQSTSYLLQYAMSTATVSVQASTQPCRDCESRQRRWVSRGVNPASWRSGSVLSGVCNAVLRSRYACPVSCTPRNCSSTSKFQQSQAYMYSMHGKDCVFLRGHSPCSGTACLLHHQSKQYGNKQLCIKQLRPCQFSGASGCHCLLYRHNINLHNVRDLMVENSVVSEAHQAVAGGCCKARPQSGSSRKHLSGVRTCSTSLIFKTNYLQS
jgi:hypothetical protein